MNIIFESKRLIMRELNLADTRQIYEYSREESMKKGIPNQVYKSMREAKEIIDFLRLSYTVLSRHVRFPYVLGIEIKDTQQLIGHVGLSEIREGIEIGYAIGEKYQKNGYASEAICALVDWAKNVLKIPTLHAVVRHDNLGSCKALEKAGFIFQNEECRDTCGEICKRRIYTK